VSLPSRPLDRDPWRPTVSEEQQRRLVSAFSACPLRKHGSLGVAERLFVENSPRGGGGRQGPSSVDRKNKGTRRRDETNEKELSNGKKKKTHTTKSGKAGGKKKECASILIWAH